MTSVQEFIVRVGERTHTVRVEGERVVVDGVARTVLVTPGGRSLVHDADGHGQRVVTLDGQASPGSASVAGVASKVLLQTAQEATLAAAMSSGRAVSAAGSRLKAPMPGRVVRVLVSVGQVVERGTAVVIVEAMKMENEITAPASGTVLHVHASEGAAVDSGQLLVELELA